jgi:hypothetical protein
VGGRGRGLCLYGFPNGLRRGCGPWLIGQQLRGGQGERCPVGGVERARPPGQAWESLSYPGREAHTPSGREVWAEEGKRVVQRSGCTRQNGADGRGRPRGLVHSRTHATPNTHTDMHTRAATIHTREWHGTRLLSARSVRPRRRPPPATLPCRWLPWGAPHTPPTAVCGTGPGWRGRWLRTGSRT